MNKTPYRKVWVTRSVHEEYNLLVSFIDLPGIEDGCCGFSFQGQTRVPVNFGRKIEVHIIARVLVLRTCHLCY